ncbi:MAG: sigma-70 family RNA polymerase sigma factor [Candidatus Krumholzibacteria bacterium]|nr:sigma-70 family RNA polymerase sigma factor [Candidatus Krumholzibacteria bacterium]
MAVAEKQPDRENQLLRDFTRGEEEAVRKVRRWILDVLLSARLNIPYDEKEDLVQDTLLSLIRTTSKEGFRIRNDLRSLTHRIAAARAIDWIRRRRFNIPIPESLASWDPDPEDQLYRKEMLARLRIALNDLSASCKDLIRQRFLEEKSYRQISEEYGEASIGALRTRMYECVRIARRLVGRKPLKA